jgi:hypothetical protein
MMNSFPSKKKKTKTNTKKLAKVGGRKIHFTKGKLLQNILVYAKLLPK